MACLHNEKTDLYGWVLYRIFFIYLQTFLMAFAKIEQHSYYHCYFNVVYNLDLIILDLFILIYIYFF